VAFERKMLHVGLMGWRRIFEYPKLKDYLKDNPATEKQVHKIYNEIAAEYTPSFVAKMSTLFDATFAKLYDDVSLQTDVDIVKLSKDTHLILVPNHQSYADFLGISYAFYKKLKLPVHIAAGINLNVFPIGGMFRKGGAFFIRRTFKDDHLYKNILEAYVFTLLEDQKVIKFYFEGGRSRNGKLLPPKYGLFQMLCETYSRLSTDKPLCFLPISISHEYLPESKSHTAEVFGGKKVQESSAQLFKIFKVFSKRFGSIHLKAGSPIYVNEIKDDVKKQVQDLAFTCFRAVGKGMMVSPTSLLAMVLLDTSGALTLGTILDRCRQILDYCNNFGIPLTPNLENKNIADEIKHALDLLVENKKINFIEKPALDKFFYSVSDEDRSELLYLKNTILHHFLVPLFISSAWINIFRGSLKNNQELTEFFLEQRKLLKHEFYLPETDEMFVLIKRIIAKTLERKDFSFNDSFSLSNHDFYQLGATVSPFTATFSYIYEGYYIAALTLKSFSNNSFKFDTYKQRAKEIFDLEQKYGKLIRFPETFSVPLMKSALDYFVGEGIATSINEGKDFVVSKDAEVNLDKITDRFVTQLSDFTSLNLKKFHIPTTDE
jgi:glycerol-3-phosphate O-acyltransferase